MTTPWIVAFVVFCACVVLIGALVVGLVRRFEFLLSEAQRALNAATAQLRSDGLEIDDLVGPFAATTIDGEAFLQSDLTGSPAVVLFVGSDCTACKRLMTHLETREGTVGAFLVVVVDDVEDARRVAGAADVVLLQRERVVAEAFKSHRTPHAFVLDESGRVRAKGSPNEWDALVQLVDNGQEGGESTITAAAAAASSSR